jgi:hypothetical protein
LPVQVLRLFAKESVNRVEHLPSILFHEDRMSALADFDPPAVRRRPELAENGQRHIDWTIPIPLGVDDQNSAVRRPGSYSGFPEAQYSRLSWTVPFGARNLSGPMPDCENVAAAQASNQAVGKISSFLSSGTPFSQRAFVADLSTTR